MLKEVIEYLNTHTKEEVEEIINQINKNLMKSNIKFEIEVEENDTVEIRVNGEVKRTITPEYKSVNDFWDYSDTSDTIYYFSPREEDCIDISCNKHSGIRKNLIKSGLGFKTKQKIQRWLDRQALQILVLLFVETMLLNILIIYYQYYLNRI